LLQQAPDALVVPESVEVDLRLVDVEKEYAIDNQKRERVPLGSVFELSRESVSSWAVEATAELPAERISIEHPLESRWQPMLFTTIRTFGEHRLEDYDSGLTRPRPLPFEGAIKTGDSLQFSYRLGSAPGLVCKPGV
jgi:hypothetical protein